MTLVSELQPPASTTPFLSSFFPTSCRLLRCVVSSSNRTVSWHPREVRVVRPEHAVCTRCVITHKTCLGDHFYIWHCVGLLQFLSCTFCPCTTRQEQQSIVRIVGSDVSSLLAKLVRSCHPVERCSLHPCPTTSILSLCSTSVNHPPRCSAWQVCHTAENVITSGLREKEASSSRRSPREP